MRSCGLVGIPVLVVLLSISMESADAGTPAGSVESDNLIIEFDYVNDGTNDVGIMISSFSQKKASGNYSFGATDSPIWQVVFREQPGVVTDCEEMEDTPTIGQQRRPIDADGWKESRVPGRVAVAGSDPCGGNLLRPYPEGLPVVDPTRMTDPGSVEITQVNANTVRLKWNNVEIPGSGDGMGGDLKTFDVRVTIAAAAYFTGGPSVLHWDIRVNGITDPETCPEDSTRYTEAPWLVYNVACPVMFLDPIGSDGADDHLLFPMTGGIVIPDPIHERTSLNADQIIAAAPSEDPCDSDEERAVCFGGAKQDNDFNYPGLVQSQFLALYDEIESSGEDADTATAGLYLAADDPIGFFKRIVFGPVYEISDTGGATPSAERDQLYLQVTHFKSVDADPAVEGWDGFRDLNTSVIRTRVDALESDGYSVVLDAFEGDWYDGAALYRAWIEGDEPDYLFDPKPGGGKMATIWDRLESFSMSEADIKASYEDYVYSTHILEYRRVDDEYALDDDPAVLRSDYSVLRAWADYYGTNGDCGGALLFGDPKFNPCDYLDRNFFCNDNNLVNKYRDEAFELIQQVRGGVDAGACASSYEPLFRWVGTGTDAGNWKAQQLGLFDPVNEAVMTGGFCTDSCACSGDTLFIDAYNKAVARYWEGTLMLKSDNDFENPTSGGFLPREAVADSGSWWLTNELRVPHWVQYFYVSAVDTNGSFDPEACPTTIADLDTAMAFPTTGLDWSRGLNFVAYTGRGPQAFPTYGPLWLEHEACAAADDICESTPDGDCDPCSECAACSGCEPWMPFSQSVTSNSLADLHQVAGTGPSFVGGGTYWMENYRYFIETVRSELYCKSGEPDHLVAPNFPERMHEQLVPFSTWAGKTRTYPFDRTFKAPTVWVETAGAEPVPMAAVLYHDFTVVASEIPSRSKMEATYQLSSGAYPSSPDAMNLYQDRYRMRLARAVVDGSFIGVTLAGDGGVGSGAMDSDEFKFDPAPVLAADGCTSGTPWTLPDEIVEDHEYIETLLDLRSQFRKYLVLGAMLRAPEITVNGAAMTVPLDFKRRRLFECSSSDVTVWVDVDKIMGSVWRSPVDGTIALVFTNFEEPDNVDGSTGQFRFSVRPEEWGLASGTYRLSEAEFESACPMSLDPTTTDAGFDSFEHDDTTSTQPSASGWISLGPGEVVVYVVEPDV